jgi:hypothetical protein
MKPGLWIESFPLLLGVSITLTTIVIAAAWREIQDVIADRPAARARKQLKLVSRHR